jgi:hypothetical protein
LVLGLYKYIDVNGTDYTTKVMSSDANRKLSDVGTCTVVLNNKGGQYKTTFSEMQCARVAQARAAFGPYSDFFIGITGAAPNATKWNTANVDGGAITISTNRLKTETTAAVAWKYALCLWFASQSVPQTIRVWAYSSRADAADVVIEDSSNKWGVFARAGRWEVYTKVGGGYALRAQSGAGLHVASTYYMVEVRVTASTCQLLVYDVFGVLVYDSAAQGMDAITTTRVWIGVSNEGSANTRITYYLAFLMWSAATPKGEWIFGGVIDKIEFTENPDMITLHCVDDAWELEKQYDETYGRATATFTPSYGATDDIAALTSALLASGWTYTAPDCAIHDKQAISINTRRIYALNELLDLTPYLGWFILPMKHFAFVMPDTDITPDSITEATAGWTAANGNSVLSNTGAYNIDGAAALDVSSLDAGVIGAYHALNFSLSTYRTIIFYYAWSVWGLGNSLFIRIYTDTATPKYWQYALPDPPSAIGTRGNMVHLALRLPDADGNHGWTATNSPDVADSIVRFYIGGEATTGAFYMYWDVLYSVAAKRITSKYTLPARISASRLLDADQYTRAMVAGSGITTQIVDDVTAQSIFGLREILSNDQSITTSEPAIALARTILNAQGWDDTADPINYTFVNPGDMYNVMLGDTVTMTISNMNLSSATRTIIARRDTLDGNGWITTLTLSGDPTKDRIENLLTMAKRKRY